VIDWKAIREVFTALKRGGVIVLLSDWGYKPDGIPCKLFGRWTTLPSGPAVLSARGNAPIVPFFVRREAPGKFRILFGAPISAGNGSPAAQLRATQETATAKVASAKKVADDARALQQKEVNKLQAIQDKLARELASAKRVRITLEQQRALALLEESSANTAANTGGQKKVWPDIGFKGRSTIRTTEAQREAAVAFAKKQVLARKPYIWGSEGPNSFDCSGLVYSAYKSAGLSWPNWDRLNSALYAGYTKHVSLSDLVPGDLLFYSYKGTISSIHHITIYAGNGMMWEANSKDKGLLYSNIYSVKGLMPFGGRV
jgi:cell wall-associated NlpC family hydrolase